MLFRVPQTRRGSYKNLLVWDNMDGYENSVINLSASFGDKTIL